MIPLAAQLTYGTIFFKFEAMTEMVKETEKVKLPVFCLVAIYLQCVWLGTTNSNENKSTSAQISII